MHHASKFLRVGAKSAQLRCTSVRALSGVPSHTSTSELVLHVASKNQVKARACEAAVSRCFQQPCSLATVHECGSGVPPQPFGDEETLRGARNRVDNARAALLRASNAQRGLVVAIEGGVGRSLGQPVGTLECFAWVIVASLSTGAESTARSASFVLPAPLSRLIIEQGLELGVADDQVFGRVSSGQGTGTIGYLSKGIITRQSYYEEAAVCALLPFMNPDYYGWFDPVFA